MPVELKRSYLNAFAFAKGWGFVKTPSPEEILTTITDVKKALGNALIAGGIAVGHHGHERVTQDVDVLYSSSSEHALLKALKKDFKMVVRAKGGWHELQHRRTKVRLELIPEGGLGTYGFIPGPKTTGGKGGFISLLGLCWLKLLAGRLQDSADLAALCKLRLSEMEAMAPRLPDDLRPRFLEILAQARREMESDPYKRRGSGKDSDGLREPAAAYGKRARRSRATASRR